MNKTKKFALLLLTVCLGCMFAGCSKFFTPLPDDFFNSKETQPSVSQPIEEEQSSVEEMPDVFEELDPTLPETSDEPNEEEIIVPPNSSEEVPTEPENSTENFIPPIEEEPIIPDEENSCSPPTSDTEVEEQPNTNEDNLEVVPPETEETTPPENSEETVPPVEETPVAPEENEFICSFPLTFTEGTHILENYLIVCGEEDRAAVYAEGAGTVVIINSGIYYGGTNGSSAPAIYARDGARIIINGGDFYTGEGNSTIYAKNYSYIEINGGKFRADGAWQGKYYVLNLADNTNAKILVKGGEFRDFDPSTPLTEPSIVSFVETGYEVVFVENVANWYCVKKIEVVE